MATNELTIDEFRDSVRKSRVECCICKHSAHSLVAHLREAHKLSPGQYRKQHPNAQVASPLAQELLRSVTRTTRSSTVDLRTEQQRFLSVVAGQTGSDALDSFASQLGWFAPDSALKEFIPRTNVNFEFTANAAHLAMAFLVGRNVFVSGPPGCGKTEEVQQVMSYLKIPCPRANMNGEVTYGSFVGMMKANSQGTYFQPGLLPRAMLGGYPLLLDEIDFTPPNIGAVLHPVLEKGRSLYISETGEHIVAKRGFMVFATGNTGGRGDQDGSFAGTEVLNSAFLDRFSVKLKADYLSQASEEALLRRSFPGISAGFCKRTAQFAQEVRAAVRTDSLSVNWSTRKVLDFAEFSLSIGSTAALDLTLYNWLDGEERNLVGALEKRVQLLREQVSEK